MPAQLEGSKKQLKKTGVWGGYNSRQIAELVDEPLAPVKYRLEVWYRVHGRYPVASEVGIFIAAMILEKTAPGEVLEFVQI